MSETVGEEWRDIKGFEGGGQMSDTKIVGEGVKFERIRRITGRAI